MRVRTSVSRRRRSRSGSRASSLDARGIDTITRFVRVLARSGYTPEDIGREVLQTCRRMPKAASKQLTATLRDTDAAAHILTHWFSDPAYLDSRGNPRALPLLGAGASLQSLLERVDRKLDTRVVLTQLMERRVLRRVRNRYQPRDRLLSFRGSGALYNARSVRVLGSMLRTLEHNSEPERTSPVWFEVIARNARFPTKAREAFDKRLRRLAMRWLVQIDGDMHRREKTRESGERTVPLGVGIYFFEEDEFATGGDVLRRPKGQVRGTSRARFK
jgi:hypothetical protein